MDRASIRSIYQRGTSADNRVRGLAGRLQQGPGGAAREVACHRTQDGHAATWLRFPAAIGPARFDSGPSAPRSFDTVLVRLSAASAPIAMVIALAIGTAVPGVAEARGRKSAEGLEEQGFLDPRLRILPRRHRFRLGLQLEYIRLSAALDSRDMSVTRYHYLPLAIDAAYQLQFAKYLMLRPSLAFGANVFNTTEAMPLVIHPQFHFGYQGSMFGAALGYGFFTPPIRNKDARSEIRDDPGQPIILNNHHIGAEVSVTTRIDRGALSFQFRFAGVTSRTLHFDVERRRWRPMIMFNIGWYFGDGRKAAERRRARENAR